MNTEALDKCLELFRAVQNFEEKKIGPLADMDAELDQPFIEPFRRELGLNLLSKPAFQEKKDLIIFYLEEIDRCIIIDRSYNEIEPVNNETDGDIYPIWYNDQYETDDSGIAWVRAHILFARLFDVIQDYCNIYHIPFIEICNERNFILDSIDLSPTRDFEEITEGRKTYERILLERQPVAKPTGIDRPIIVQDYLDEVYEAIRDFFSTEDQISLRYMLVNNTDVESPVVFLDMGNRLADAFKQLYEANIIRGCQKKELESWISRNFAYVYRGEIRPFLPKYLNEIISTTKDKCKRPFLDVRFDKNQNKNILIKL